MDALRKAEEAKRQSEAAAKIEPRENAPAEGVPAEPAAAGTNADARGLPELPSRLELLDHEFHPSPAARPEPSIAPAQAARQSPDKAQQRDRAAAQNVFQAKQPAQKNNAMILVGVTGLLAVVGIGGYFWWQMQPKGGLGPAPVTARSAAPPAPMAAAPIAPTPMAAPAPAPIPVPAAPAAPAASAPEPVAVPPTLTFGKKAAAAPAPTPAEPESPIRITTGKLKIHPQVASAYQAFQAGDLATAQRDYQSVLKNEPKNIDALHGLAAISLHQRQYEAAEGHYLRILEADPKDSAAQAGLIGLKGQVDPSQSESRLKNLLAGQPDSPTLNFTLGNLYAQQGRWNEAQQAYFRAYTGDGENPDYQFNLAVSLEQLRQPRLALQYYQGALAAATQRPAAFDRNQVAGRVSELQK